MVTCRFLSSEQWNITNPCNRCNETSPGLRKGSDDPRTVALTFHEYQGQFRWGMIYSVRFLFGTAPIICSTTFPPLNAIRVGMLLMPNLSDTSGLLSTSSFPTLSLPSYSLAISSTIGATIL